MLLNLWNFDSHRELTKKINTKTKYGITIYSVILFLLYFRQNTKFSMINSPYDNLAL